MKKKCTCHQAIVSDLYKRLGDKTPSFGNIVTMLRTLGYSVSDLSYDRNRMELAHVYGKNHVRRGKHRVFLAIGNIANELTWRCCCEQPPKKRSPWFIFGKAA